MEVEQPKTGDQDEATARRLRLPGERFRPDRRMEAVRTLWKLLLFLFITVGIGQRLVYTESAQLFGRRNFCCSMRWGISRWYWG